MMGMGGGQRFFHRSSSDIWAALMRCTASARALVRRMRACLTRSPILPQADSTDPGAMGQPRRRYSGWSIVQEFFSK